MRWQRGRGRGNVIERRATGDVNPDSFTHGTSAQRAKWFRAGQSAGAPADCDTFSVDDV